MARHLIVSNRQPDFDTEGGAGGLAVALKAALQDRSGIWLGWSGRTVASPSRTPRHRRCDNIETLSIDLTEDEQRGYYLEFANRTLWPLFHGRIDLASFDHSHYATYRAVNRRFAEALLPVVGHGDSVWVHDYHLIPLASELRRLGVSAKIGFFLHIPFPEKHPLETLPWLQDLMDDLCRYDLVGFQTESCRMNFLHTIENHPTSQARTSARSSTGRRSVRTGAFPISIDTGAFRRLATSPAVLRREHRLMRLMGGQDWVLGVERLDYTKGLPERFLAFERLLETQPELRGEVSLMQIAAPSRLDIEEYRHIQRRLETLVGHINGRFATEEWPPLRYINRCFSHAQIAALYRRCRVGLVTPLCDGMNLVAKEYVAAQDEERPGVLILSRFAGAAEQMTDALIVNPHDLQEVAMAIRHALHMGLEERRRRWSRMMADLEANTVQHWVSGFLAALEEATVPPTSVRNRSIA